MDEQLNELATEAGSMVLDWLRAAGEMAADQAPVLAEEIVRRGLVINGMSFVILFVLAMGLAFVAWMLIQRGLEKKSSRSYSTDGDGFIGFGCVTAFVATVALLASFLQATDFASILVAPRLYVLETLARIIK